MPFEPDARQVGLARGAADRAMAAARKTPGPQQIGEWTARELRAFRVEDAARLETLAEAPVMLKAEPAEMLGDMPTATAAEPAEDATPVHLYPQTAREALLEIRRLAATITKPVSTAAFEEVAREGLARTEPINFELTDQLADRLAEAHKALVLVKEHLYGKLPDGDNEIEGIISEALSLPPDLETMVERRHLPKLADQLAGERRSQRRHPRDPRDPGQEETRG
jgi:hypothetical protein